MWIFLSQKPREPARYATRIVISQSNMSSSSLPTLLNLRPPINDPLLAGSASLLTPLWQSFFTNLNGALLTLATFNPANYGATGNGIADDTAAVQVAISAAVKAGGGIIQFEAGKFSINTVKIPVGTAPLFLQGVGPATMIIRRSALTPGQGLFDVSGSNVSFSNMLIDGATTTPKGLQYNHDFIGVEPNDPMAGSLTTNTSVWVHGGVSGISFYKMTFRHAGGYSILLDARTAGINDVDIVQCSLQNNRPALFGTTPGQLIYGSWNGGILAMGDGRTNAQQVVSDLLVAQCRFERNDGNCLWSALYALSALHSQFRFIGNRFIDCGLDGIEVGGVTGGVVLGNIFRRVGYTTLTDTDQSVPRWLPNLQATALDSSGLVKGVDYIANSFTSINGGSIDTDGHGDSSISCNIMRVPFSDEPEYFEDSIAISGPTNSGSESYGINVGNTQDTPYGGRWITIASNTFINLSAGAVRLYSARDCLVATNSIIAPNDPVAPPIAMGAGGPGPNQRATGNVVKHNRCEYSPSVSAPFVFEDPTIEPFVGSDVNYCYGNCPIIGNGLAVEFQPNGSSGSPTYLQTVWFV